MTTKSSAYLSIYNDWDILAPALRSVAPFIDELVVVDGAYEWMVPYLDIIGRNPRQSDPRVYAAIREAGIPFRVIQQTWKNEPEKRMAGYAACTTRYVYRVDADEILFFDRPALERFFASGDAVASMQMPTHKAPGFIKAVSEASDIERQCFLFDREQVNAETHLNYLWLVLEADVLPAADTPRLKVHPAAVAYNAHLTEWRTPETAVNRAAFYTLNHARKHGVAWLPELAGRAIEDFRPFFSTVNPNAFFDFLMGSALVTGHMELKNGIVRPSPLSAEQEASFAGLFDSFLAANARLNRALTHRERYFVLGNLVSIDISSAAGLQALAAGNTVKLRLSVPPHAAQVRLRCLTAAAPYETQYELPFRIQDTELQFTVPAETPAQRNFIRRTLEFQVWSGNAPVLQRFKAVAAEFSLAGSMTFNATSR